ncbi:MAG: type VI secretion IcmF C-terminal domain-containing protein [Stenotrophomonas sp.]|uniref:type VI secretion IcmF C-terminal domain-containing protein n=1 Tax=Stenotrophomonas sp. TaxID=69392 RepID=UPI003D6C9E1E
MISRYFDTLSKLRGRLNAIKSQGDIGVGARNLMQDTFKNEGSEFTAALALVDEQVLTGLDEKQREALRPLLLRPLTQTFAALAPLAEEEINKSWKAQVYGPFKARIGAQYPFNLNSDVDAAASDIAGIFGATGSIATFNKDAMGTLVIQRGPLLEARRWAGIGINLSADLVANYGNWVSGSAAGVAQDSTIFEILPAPATGAVEYTIEIDGQALRYRNTPPQWMTMQYPNPGHMPGVRITAVTGDGRTLEIFNAPGTNGFKRLMAEGSYERVGDSSRITWAAEGVGVTVEMRIVRRAGAGSDGSDWQKGLQLPERVAGSAPVAAASPAGSVNAGASP